VSQGLPSFDLVLATVDRVEELGRFLDSVGDQRYPRVRLIVVDQNPDERIAAVLDGRELEIVRLRSGKGLSRARNEALSHVRADIVAFPDDDCVYPSGLLQRVAEHFAASPALDGLTGRAEDASGGGSGSWKTDPAVLSDRNLWNRAISFAIFLRRGVVEQVGAFDERLGLGSGEPWSSGEEIDYLVRAVRAGSRIEYDPSLVVLHDVRADDARIGYRDGASVGYLLRKHGYRARTIGRMLVRPAGGAVAELLRRDASRSRFHVAALRGRLRGLASRRAR
jgi:glycosyltransferase involved in cell wall biosynthesis